MLREFSRWISGGHQYVREYRSCLLWIPNLADAVLKRPHAQIRHEMHIYRMVCWIWKLMVAQHSVLHKHHFALFCIIPWYHFLFCRPMQHPSQLETNSHISRRTVYQEYDVISNITLNMSFPERAPKDGYPNFPRYRTTFRWKLQGAIVLKIHLLKFAGRLFQSRNQQALA